MPRFKIGDRVRVARSGGSWLDVYVGAVGTIWDDCIYPWIDFDDGTRDCGSEECLELVSEETHTPSHIEINGSLYRRAEENVVPSHIEINGKRYRLVEEA